MTRRTVEKSAKPRGYCNGKVLRCIERNLVTADEKRRILEGECGLKDPLDCKIHARAAIKGTWDVAASRLAN